MRARLPGGIVEVAVVFDGLQVSSCTVTTKDDPERWVDATRHSWEAAGWEPSEHSSDRLDEPVAL